MYSCILLTLGNAWGLVDDVTPSYFSSSMDKVPDVQEAGWV